MAQPNFKFTGDISLPKEDSKRPFCKIFEKDGVKMASMNFGVKESKNNMGFVECFGSIPKDKKIKTLDVNNNKIEIPWDKRFEKESIESVASYKKFVVDLDKKDRQEFITAYDAICYLKEKLPEFEGKVCVTGQVQKQFYKDKYYDKFQFVNVYAVDDAHVNKLTVTTDFYYKKDSIDKDDWKEKKVIAIDGYIQMYINDEKATKFMPQRVVLNASKVDTSNELHVKRLKNILKYIEIPNKKMAHLLWESHLINGTDEQDFDESQLTDIQREQVELGIRTLEDFRPNGAILGNRIVEYRLVAPVFKGDFAEGVVDTEMSDSEFEDLIFVPNKDEKLSDVMKEAKKETEKESEDNDIDEDDLFS